MNNEDSFMSFVGVIVITFYAFFKVLVGDAPNILEFVAYIIYGLLNIYAMLHLAMHFNKYDILDVFKTEFMVFLSNGIFISKINFKEGFLNHIIENVLNVQSIERIESIAVIASYTFAILYLYFYSIWFLKIRVRVNSQSSNIQ